MHSVTILILCWFVSIICGMPSSCKKKEKTRFTGSSRICSEYLSCYINSTEEQCFKLCSVISSREREDMNEWGRGREENTREGKGGKAKRNPTPGQWMLALSLLFLDLIYHIITPRKKKTSISRRNGDVSMENLGILVHNRSGVKKSKRSKAELPGV